MSNQIKLSQLIGQLPEVRATLIQNRRFIIVPVAAALGYLLLRDPIKDARDHFFSWIYTKYFLAAIDKHLFSFRQEMKYLLAKQRSQDPHPHNDETLRILEIGAGPGSNLDFYPKSSRVMILEPNAYFLDTLLKKQKSHSEVVRVICGYAEDLSDIQDESIDAVVSTLVLCSVGDLDKSLKEVKRVLVKGGRLYLFEHILDTHDRTRRLTQYIVSPMWSLIYDGCQISRDINAALVRAGFDIGSKRNYYVTCFWKDEEHGK
ncbi:methyltransferase protein 7A-like [Tropilaelaps mercedesae]|uniref:Methyltransferase protein 7A-like n=1 Tax=Tropilaelaps mercedesae TaxID=418985 RepID=A0A1V9X698_9ACAR|nr:methyltransferase protein 7A-like [Tropilaelaps mercedesae]